MAGRVAFRTRSVRLASPLQSQRCVQLGFYRLYVLENIRRGQQDAAAGKTEPAEDVLKDMQSW
ncbi:MAG: hypothetical protein C1943_07665 [Halochromatium sp.]|nr:hypothetical protein [Halochromatium sp.]